MPHLRAKVVRRRLKKATPGGPKKEAPGVKFRPPWGPKRASGASWAPGRPQEGALGGKGGGGKLYGGLLGPSWSPFGASWARCWSIFPPGGRGRGGSRRSFLKLFLDVLAERPKKDNLAHMLMFISYIFLCYVLSPVAFLAAWPAAPHKCKNVENPLVFVGRKPYASFFRQRPKQSNFRGHA